LYLGPIIVDFKHPLQASMSIKSALEQREFKSFDYDVEVLNASIIEKIEWNFRLLG